MRKLIYILTLLLFTGCDTENAPDCFKTTGTVVQKEVEVPFFDKIALFDKIDLFIAQADQQMVLIEAGENFMEDIRLNVTDQELQVSGNDNCNLFREYGTIKVYITVPDLKRIQHNSAGAIRSEGVLNFETLNLISLNQERDSDIYTNGEFFLNLNCGEVGISSDNIAKFYLSGTTDHLQIGFYNGDGRIDASGLIAQHVRVFHRGSNKMIVNPQHTITGEIRSTGNVISKNEPPEVDVESFYTGRLIFE